MEVYILDSLLRREKIYDRFKSLIWTERWREVGDFELVLYSTPDVRQSFVSGKMLALNASNRVMVVETVEDGTDDEGERLFTVKGRSLEKILIDRAARAAMEDLTTTPKWTLSGTPGNIARQVFQEICVDTVLDPNDSIPFYQPGSMYPTPNIAEDDSLITRDIEPKTVYQAIKEICEVYDMGFRLTRNVDLSELYFDVYTGNDHTSSQSVLPAVIFAPDLDNMRNTTEFTTTALEKNVAYVFSNLGFEVVLAANATEATEGFERRVLLVKITDLDETLTPTEATEAMIQRGKEELNKNRSLSAFDGEISEYSNYRYGIDYELGDLVEMRNSDGVTNNMRVTEQIFVYDEEGERSYPTLSINLFINPGAWIAWDFNQTWLDLDSDPVTWSELP